MVNITIILNKDYADRYITENYMVLSAKFRVLDHTINDNGISSLDKLNDTCLTLYTMEVEYVCYADFEKIANRKFKVAMTKPKREKTD